MEPGPLIIHVYIFPVNWHPNISCSPNDSFVHQSYRPRKPSRFYLQRINYRSTLIVSNQHLTLTSLIYCPGTIKWYTHLSTNADQKQEKFVDRDNALHKDEQLAILSAHEPRHWRKASIVLLQSRITKNDCVRRTIDFVY